MEEFTPCGECDNGFIYDHENDTARKCQCLIDYQCYRKMEIRLKKAGIPYNFIKDYHIRKYIGNESRSEVKKLKTLIKNFNTSFFDKVLYFWGKMGTQKTTLTYWVGRELVMKDVNVKYVLMNDLVKHIQNESFQEEYDSTPFYNADCLIIDRAFDSSQVTLYKSGYQIPFLDNFLRKRIDQLQKCTIFISNIPVSQISNHGFGTDIEDLIRRKTEPFDTILEFKDHYSLKDDFNEINLWEE